MIVDNNAVRTILYWVFNVISPSINSQAIVTYLMAQKSEFCQDFASILIDDTGSSFFKSIGDDTMGVNGIILVFHTCLLICLLIGIDSGFVKHYLSRLFSCLRSPIVMDETRMDNDVLAERQRILKLNELAINSDGNGAFGEAEHDAGDHLTVHDLVKRFRGRPLPAVNHLTFGARRGEAFGLLGYNVRFFFQNLEVIFHISNVVSIGCW